MSLFNICWLESLHDRLCPWDLVKSNQTKTSIFMHFQQQSLWIVLYLVFHFALKTLWIFKSLCVWLAWWGSLKTFERTKAIQKNLNFSDMVDANSNMFVNETFLCDSFLALVTLETTPSYVLPLDKLPVWPGLYVELNNVLLHSGEKPFSGPGFVNHVTKSSCQEESQRTTWLFTLEKSLL